MSKVALQLQEHDLPAPINILIGQKTIEHILAAVKQWLQKTAEIRCRILNGKEWEENHQLNYLGTGEFAVGFLFESHLPFSDVYSPKNVHNPLYTESAATFREKIEQLRDYLPIFVYARVCLFGAL